MSRMMKIASSYETAWKKWFFFCYKKREPEAADQIEVGNANYIVPVVVGFPDISFFSSYFVL